MAERELIDLKMQYGLIMPSEIEIMVARRQEPGFLGRLRTLAGRLGSPELKNRNQAFRVERGGEASWRP